MEIDFSHSTGYILPTRLSEPESHLKGHTPFMHEPLCRSVPLVVNDVCTYYIIYVGGSIILLLYSIKINMCLSISYPAWCVLTC